MLIIRINYASNITLTYQVKLPDLKYQTFFISLQSFRFAMQNLNMNDFSLYLDPVSLPMIMNDQPVTDGLFAKHITIFQDHIPDIEFADIIIIGIQEQRGARLMNDGSKSADAIRKHFYQLNYWHTDVRIADLGNVKTGATIQDSYAAQKTVIGDLIAMGKTVFIIGGSHDNTMAQYESYRDAGYHIEATCIDANIDLRSESMIRSENFLLDMLTTEPNIIKHYNHIGFQSYFVHPRMIETLDKLRFDCYRVGMVKEKIDEMEPVLRNSHLVSFDINAIKNSDSPASKLSPNGLDGTEACTLMRYAGMSSNVNSTGVYGYNYEEDSDDMTAIQISQMLWYFIDGRNKCMQESNLNERHNFNEFHTAFAEVDTVFLQSKKTNRWWMQLPDKKFIACSYDDYAKASSNEIPERWLRIQERI